MLWMLPLLEKLCEQNNVQCHWHFYFTGDQAPSQAEQDKLKAIGRLYLYRERPDWQTLVAEIAATGIRPTCYVCGPDAMSRQVKKACRKQGWVVHKEEF